MRDILLISTLLIFISCQSNLTVETKEQLELIRIGLPEKIDSTNFIEIGAELYIKFDNADSIFMRVCENQGTNIDLPNKPPKCINLSQGISKETQSYYKYFLEFIRNRESGELMINKPDNYSCDIIGLWVARYTINSKSKYFLFDCYGLPDSIKFLCSEYFQNESILTAISDNNLSINSDSIAHIAYENLKNEFKLRQEKASTTLKFIPPKE